MSPLTVKWIGVRCTPPPKSLAELRPESYCTRETKKAARFVGLGAGREKCQLLLRCRELSNPNIRPPVAWPSELRGKITRHRNQGVYTASTALFLREFRRFASDVAVGETRGYRPGKADVPSPSLEPFAATPGLVMATVLPHPIHKGRKQRLSAGQLGSSWGKIEGSG